MQFYLCYQDLFNTLDIIELSEASNNNNLLILNTDKTLSYIEKLVINLIKVYKDLNDKICKKSITLYTDLNR